MPRKEALSIIEIQSIIESKVKVCALCGSHNWRIEPDLFNIRFNSPWASGNHKLINCALLSCSDCGNTHILNVNILENNVQREKRKKA